MFERHQHLITIRGGMLALCLTLLAACAGTHNNSTSGDASAPESTPTVPAMPANPTATPGNATATVNWTASSGATSYNVKRATTDGGPYTQVAAPTSASYTDAPLTNGTTYYYVISALNSAGESANSAQVSAVPAAPATGTSDTTPAVPSGLTASGGNSQASLTWTASTGATSYHVKRATTNGGPYTQVAVPTAASYTDSSLTNGTTYYYVISALNSAGESANSAQASARPAAPASSSVPGVPAGLTASAGNAQVSLTWTASNGATSYHVKRATASGGPYTQVGAPTTVSFTNTSLANGTTYYYVVSALNSAGESANSAPINTLPVAPTVSASCGMQLANTPAIFCDTFDAPAPLAGTRTGDLDPNVWGVSRATGQVNFGGALYNSWGDTPLITCAGTNTVRTPKDVMICNGQVHEGTNDNPQDIYDEGVVLSLAMYPKQPFDFAGRTGTVGFDVSNDNHGNHGAWPEFWMSNLPVPDPFNHFGSWISLPQHGFGIRMGSGAAAGNFGQCPNTNNINSPRWTVDSAVIVRNYIMEDVDYQGLSFGTASNPAVKLNILDCVIAPADGSLITNHVEIRVSQAEIDIYASDAGVAPTPQNMRKIASVTNVNLSFTRGLIWLEDVHYNADKGGAPSQRSHTFAWDNVAFDGPFTYRDFSYDAPDANAACCNASNIVNLGQFALANAQATWNIANLPANPQASAVRVLFNFSNETNPIPTVLNVTVNGHAHPTPWPYPDTLQNTWRTFAVTIPITDLVPGTNVVQLGSDQPMVSSNVDLVLVDVPGGVPVLPGSNNAYPAH